MLKAYDKVSCQFRSFKNFMATDLLIKIDPQHALNENDLRNLKFNESSNLVQ